MDAMFGAPDLFDRSSGSRQCESHYSSTIGRSATTGADRQDCYDVVVYLQKK